ncbi:MAG TPA: triphosphoribosyl-dephospho-CoA synthase [Gemmatimonadaceae bacterium]|nr:triphosphoribosyl-dephospho-CoA synthase [Gemmatimonadaceae bacterium]
MTSRAADVASAVQLACLLEASAPKPGNVTPTHRFDDVGYEHFLASAAAIGPAFSLVSAQPLGRTILDAARATARWAPANTNLGIILLLAPLARAAVARTPSLREQVGRVLTDTTVGDAADAYEAIRLARPGGVGRAAAQDVGGTPTVSLLDAMRLAAGRDAIAREYATAFATTFDVGAPTLAHARRDGLSWDDAIVECFLALLATTPDTLIARKLGPAAASSISRQAAQIRDKGGVRSTAGRAALARFDAALRGDRNVRNPGATADLTAAAIFVTLACGDRR